METIATTGTGTLPDATLRLRKIGTATITVAAGQTNPQTFSASPTSGVAPLAVSFYFTKPSGDGQYTLDFGDGSSSSSWKAAFENANSLYQSHTYTSLGTYTVKLRRPPLPNEANCVGADCWVVGTATITVAAGQTNPQTFSASPTSGVAPLAVSFYFTKPSGDGQYTLDFGDGSSSSSWKAAFENANSLYQSHTYTSLGTYTVKLRRPPLPNEANCVGADCWVVGTATITVAAGQTSPLTFSTLNASDKSSFINLSNGNLTAVAGMELNDPRL